MNTEGFCILTDVAEVHLGRHGDEVEVVGVLQRVHHRSGGVEGTGVVHGAPVGATGWLTAVLELGHFPVLDLAGDNFIQAVALLEPFDQGEDLVSRTHGETGGATVLAVGVVVHRGEVCARGNNLRVR